MPPCSVLGLGTDTNPHVAGIAFVITKLFRNVSTLKGNSCVIKSILIKCINGRLTHIGGA